LFWGGWAVRILIVDDSKAMRMIVARELRSAGFSELLIAEASSGAEAISVMKDFNPELVLSDWNMPEMNGLEFLKTLRTGGCAVPFGFITTEASPEMRTAASEAGAFSFITKPFTADDLRDALSQFA
jgi:two-component system chemotaxis response regulator CheY